MRELLRIYKREWLALIILSVVFVSSFYLVRQTYTRYRETRYLLRQVRASLTETESVLGQLRQYQRYPFWRNLEPPQEIQIFEKVGLRPLEESIVKLSDLYTERGFFFLEEFRLNTCLDRRERSGNRRGVCRPHIFVKGKKAVF